MHVKKSPGDLVFRRWKDSHVDAFHMQKKILKKNGYLLIETEQCLDGDVLFIYEHPKTLKHITLNLMS